MAEGLTCLIKVGAEADQNYQNYILRALGQIMLYVDGMNGVIGHTETIQWLYLLIGSKFRLVVKTSLKLLLVFVEYSESNAPLLIQAINTVDTKRDVLEEQGMESVCGRYLGRKGTDLDLLEQLSIYEATLGHEDGAEDARRDRRTEGRGLQRRRSHRHSLGRSGPASPLSPASPHRANFQELNE
ncbi:hypothetical protein cypCar_00047762, partial [Cyprinus carpio]